MRESGVDLVHRNANEFAHNPNATFNDARTVSWMQLIPAEDHTKSSKSKFTLCAVQLIGAIENDALR